MRDTQRLEITVGDVKRMAERCPTAREVLKEGFPNVFEPEWEDITRQGGLLVAIRDPQEGKQIGVLDATGMDIYETETDCYRTESVSRPDSARRGQFSNVCLIYRRKQ